MIKSISVIMPVYNSERFISRAIKSILNQTFRNFEFLIIDSSSTDKTEEIIKSFADLRIVYHKIKRCSLSESLNYGLNIAKYEIIARMDADDFSYSNRFETQLKYFERDATIDILSTQYFLIKNKLKIKFENPSEHSDIKKIFALHSVINHAAVMYKKNIILDNFGYRNLPAEDYDLWLRLKDKVKFANTKEYLFDVYYYDSSIQRSNKDLLRKNVYKLQQPYYDRGIEIEFGLNNNEAIITTGWREYFYGNKNKSRTIWINPFKYFLFDKRIPIAYLISYLPNNIFYFILELRFRILIKSIFNK